MLLLIWLCALTGRYACELTRHRDPSYGAKNNPRSLLYASEMHRVAREETRKTRRTYHTHLAELTRTRVPASLTWRNSLSLFNVRDETGRPSLSRTLCQNMIVKAQRNHRVWAAEEGRRDIEMKAMRHDQAVRTTHIYHLFYLRTVLLRPPFYPTPLFVRSAIWPCFIKLHFFVSLSDLFRCENILKWIVSPTKEWKILFEQIFSEILNRIKLDNITRIK